MIRTVIASGPRPTGRRRALALALALGAALAPPPASAAPSLDARGTNLPRRHVESLFAPALRAPRDPAALDAALGRLIAELQGAGYLDARASAGWDSIATPVLRVAVDEGRRYRLASLAIDTPAPRDSARFAAALEVSAGGWVSPAALGEGVARAVREAADGGYPYATLGVSVFRWDSSGAHVRLSGALGPEVTITRVRIEGLHATRPSFVARAMGPLTGVPFSQAKAVAARDRLARLGLFRTVEFVGLEGEGDWRSGQLVYRVEETRYNQFEGAVGVQGGGQAVGLARLALDNLAGTGRALGLRWQSHGRGRADFGARYAEPLLFGTNLGAEVGLEQLDQDTLYHRTRWGGRLSYPLSERDRITGGYVQERVVQRLGDAQSASIQATEFALERDTRDLPSAPRRGRFARMSASQTFKGEVLRSGGRRSVRSNAVEAQLDWHRGLGRTRGLTLELSGGARFSTEPVLPIYERYPVGGAASLRGHDEQAYWVDRFALSRLEWRWFMGGQGERVFLFWDHAIMSSRVALAGGGTRMDTMQKDGVGFGLRLDAVGGTVGVDYGLEPGRAPLDGKIHLRLVSTF